MHLWKPLVCAIFCVGCAPSLAPHVTRESSQTGYANTFVIVSPVNRNRLPPSELEGLSDASEVAREALEHATVQQGGIVVPRRQTDSLLQIGLSGQNDLTYGQAAWLGKASQSNLVLIGKIYEYRRGSLLGVSTTVDLLWEVIDSNGVLLKRIHHRETAAQEDPADLTRAMSKKMAAPLTALWRNPQSAK